MSTFITNLVDSTKSQITRVALPDAVQASSIAVYSFGLVYANQVSYRSRIKQLFAAIRDINFVSSGDPTNDLNDLYATVNIDGAGGIVIDEGVFPAITVDEIRIGVASGIRFRGSGVLERMVIEAFDWGNENNLLI